MMGDEVGVRLENAAAMPLPPVESGLLLGQFPYARVGDGARSLVVFPGINDALQKVTGNPKFAAWFCQALCRDRSVYLISRRPQLASGFTVRDMAADYARIFARQLGRTDLMGLSMGGAIALEFAAAYPECVDRLVLAMAGPRLATQARPVCEHWVELARAQRWRELYLDMIDQTYGTSRRAVFEAMMPTAEHLLGDVPSGAADFIISVEACLSYDTTERLPAIRAHTLVIGATEDPLMPVEGVRELAERIPHTTLKLFEGAGHGAFEECKEEFDEAVLSFLDS